MRQDIKPPKGSRIRILEQDQGITIYWEISSLSRRYLIVILLVCIFIIALPNGRELINFFHRQYHPFIFFIFICSLVASLNFIRLIWKYLRPTKPEFVLINQDGIEYNSGQHPFVSSNNIVHKFSRSESPEFLFQTFGSYKRICWDLTDQPLVIGEGLSNEDREWLYGILKNWIEIKFD